ncbi:MAG: NAD(P)/FAD-dependent oxidoreductase [Anaerolineaceae bacterium]|nr:NAD(P)/FAD-dependent oxidoreductase [Anaerolineaceae bacterium]
MTQNTNSHTIAVVGGGIMGVALAHKLSQNGFAVTVYERGSNLGGLAGYIDYDGIRMDRFYHTILSSDMSMQNLMEAGGVTGKRHFVATKQGFYDKGKLYPFNTPLDFLLFPPLNIFQRFRLGLQVIYAQFESDWHKMDVVPVADWLIKVSGRGVYNKVWKPLLRAKFDTTATDVPATYIWSRLRRMMGTREGVQSTEMMCYLENGYYTLIEALAQQCSERGVTFHLNTAVQEVVIEDGRAVGIQTAEGLTRYDAVISTLPSPVLSPLIPSAPDTFRTLLSNQQYLGVLCPMLLLKKSLMPFYVLNITDETIPFTAIVETTNLIDPQYTNGHHIVYLPKYLAPDNEMAQWPDDRVREEWMKHFRRMFPDFDESLITEFWVHRAKYVEPIRPMNTLDEIPPMQTPVERLYMGNTVMIYPELGNGEAVTRYAAKIADRVIADAPTWSRQAAAVPG